ncbi:hypothetical protein [Streptomyces sp. NPDC058486]
MKHSEFLRDCRWRGNGLHHTVLGVVHMHDLAPTPPDQSSTETRH